MSTSDSEDEAYVHRNTVKEKPETKASRRNASYQNLLNANNKFSEMLKNKIQQSAISPIVRHRLNDSTEYEFDPVASSTQIGTPNIPKKLKEKTDKKPISTTAGTVKKLQKPSSETTSSSDENESTSKQKTEVINISSTVARDSSSESSDEKSTNSSSDSEEKRMKQKKLKPRNQSNSDKRSTVPNKKSKPKLFPKQKKDRNTSSDDSSFENEDAKKIKQIKLKERKSSSSGSESDSDRTKSSSESSSSSDNETATSKKLKQKDESSSSDVSSSNEFVQEKRELGPERLNNYSTERSLQRLKGANNFLNDVKPKEEVFLIQVPIKIDPKSLTGVNISLSEAKRIPQLKKYDTIPTSPKQGSVSLFCNSDDERIRIINPVRYIKIQRHLKEKSSVEVPQLDKNAVSFPNTLKERHPLFGSDFSKKINIEDHIKQKLEAAVASYNKKKTKNEKKKRKESEKQEPQEEIFKFLNQSIPTSKNDDSTVDETRHKKKKKKKKKHDESVLELSASSMNESLKKKKKYDESVLELSASSMNESLKKKKKHDESVLELSASSMNESLKKKNREHTVENDSFKNKKKKQRTSDVNESFIENEFEQPTSAKKKHKGKNGADGKKRKNEDLDDNSATKKKKSGSGNEDSLIKELLLSESDNLYKKKKKKKKKSEATDD